MAMMSGVILLVAVVWGAVFVILCFLERALAHKKAWWPGLILPAISLLWALFSSLNYPQSTTSTDPLVIAASIGMNFLLGNLPTYVFLLIYGVVRSKSRKQRELEKMNLQDL